MIIVWFTSHEYDVSCQMVANFVFIINSPFLRRRLNLSDEKSLLNLSEDLKIHQRQIVVGATKFSLNRDYCRS